MEFKQERSNCKQFIGTHKFKGLTDTKKNFNYRSPYKRSHHNIKSKTLAGNKCKKCQERAKNIDNHEDLFTEKNTAKQIHQTRNKKEIKICNTIKPSEATKFKENINKDGFEMETRKKKGGKIIVYGETKDSNQNKHTIQNNTKVFKEPIRTKLSDPSDSSAIKHSKKCGRKSSYTKQKNILNSMDKLDSQVVTKKGEIRKLKKVNKQDKSMVDESQTENSTFSTSTKDSIKGIHIYREEMIKHNHQMTSPLIGVISAEENIDIYESQGKLKTQNDSEPLGDAEKHKHKGQSQHGNEDNIEHNNVTEKEYLQADTGRQIEDLISKVIIQNKIREENLSNKENKKKSKFSNTFKDIRSVEIEKKTFKNSGKKTPPGTTLDCDIYENSIDERTPRSQRSLSDSGLRFKMKMYKYKSRKNKIISKKYSTKSLSNNKVCKSLQSIKQNHLCNKSLEKNQMKKKQQQELKDFSTSYKKAIKSEKLDNGGKFEISFPKNDSDSVLSHANLQKFNQEQRIGNEDQWCFVDPGLYSCDSELILEDGQKTIENLAPTHRFISSDNSNESWSNDNISKANISIFSIDSTASLEDVDENFLEINNTLECSNGQELESTTHIKTIQNEYNKIKPKQNENCYRKNGFFNNNPINDSSDKNVNKNRSKRLRDTIPHQSAVTLISGFGSKSSTENQLRKNSEDEVDQLNSSLLNTDISLNIKKDAAISASNSYEILRKTKFFTDKAIMCYEALPSKRKKPKQEKLRKIQQNNQKEAKQSCNTFLEKQDEIHHSGCRDLPDLLNAGDSEAVEKNVLQRRKCRSIYSEKKQPRRSTKYHNSLKQNQEENKTDIYIRPEELEDVKIKFKDNFTTAYNQENTSSRQTKGFWNTLRTGGQRFVRFLQDSASFKTCFKKNIFK